MNEPEPWLTYPVDVLCRDEHGPQFRQFLIVAETQYAAALCLRAVLAQEGIDLAHFMREEDTDADR